MKKTKANVSSVDDYILRTTGVGHEVEDRNNCALDAMSAITGRKYKEVYEEFKALGRRSRQGTYTRVIRKYMEGNSSKGSWRVLSRREHTNVYVNKGLPVQRKMTVGSFAKAYPKGRFYVLVRSHALAVVDGTILDNFDSSSRRITQAWEYIPENTNIGN